MWGTLVNALAVIVGGIVGMLLKKKMPQRIRIVYFQVIGLFTIGIGITMLVGMKHILLIVMSLVIGVLIGEWLHLEQKLEKWSESMKNRFQIGSEQFSEGFVTAFLLFCIGSMTILGSIQEGLTGSADLLFTKSLMDGFSAIILASAFGVGVIFSSIPLLIFQGGLTLLAMAASSFFTPDLIEGISNIGGILLIGLGINILEIKKLAITNMLPSLVVVIILLWAFA
jgi:uncharacterized membrane protein YqgA involved in biofilm formation